MKSMKTLLLLSIAAPLFAHAESVPAPIIGPGDTRTYVETFERAPSVWRQRREEIVVLRTTPEHIYFESFRRGAAQQ